MERGGCTFPSQRSTLPHSLFLVLLSALRPLSFLLFLPPAFPFHFTPSCFFRLLFIHFSLNCHSLHSPIGSARIFFLPPALPPFHFSIIPSSLAPSFPICSNSSLFFSLSSSFPPSSPFRPSSIFSHLSPSSLLPYPTVLPPPPFIPCPPISLGVSGVIVCNECYRSCTRLQPPTETWRSPLISQPPRKSDPLKMECLPARICCSSFLNDYLRVASIVVFVRLLLLLMLLILRF